MHAEIHCLNVIRNLDINFAKVKLYVYRTRKDQDFGLSRPCASCIAAIRDLGIRQIYYTTNEGYVFEKIEIKN
jgi:tRNA(Arg) A34 adenosine deaminase TadA